LIPAIIAIAARSSLRMCGVQLMRNTPDVLVINKLAGQLPIVSD
jgi:hypothetical protein